MMPKIAWAVAHYAAAAALVLVAYHLGRRLTRRLPYASAAEAFACAAGIGLAALAYAMFAAGTLGRLTPTVAIGVLVAAIAVSTGDWRDSFRVAAGALKRLPSLGMRGWLAIVAAAAGLVLVAPVLALPLYPPSQFDATAYHLAIAKEHVDAQRLVVSPYLRFAVLPQTANVLFAMALLLYDDLLAQLLQFVCLILTLAALVAFGRRHFTARAGYWAAALTAASPLMLWLATTAYVDMMAVCYSTLCALAWWNWQATRQRSWAVVAGVLAGIAISVKFSAAIVLLPLGLVAIGVRPSRRRIADLMVIAAVALAVMAPWMTRAAYYAHNPIYPMFFRTFGRLFGYGTLGEEHYAGFFADMNFYGMGKGFGDLVRLPWNVAANWGAFDAPAPLALVLFLTLPLAAIGLTRHSGVARLVAVILSATVIWFFSKQVLRYWLPVLPLLCLAIAASLDLLIRAFTRPADDAALIRHERGNGRAGPGQVARATVVAALLASSGWRYASEAVRERGSLPVTAVQRDEYLADRLTSYALYELLRRDGTPDARIYAIQDENMTYFVDGTLLGHYGGPARYELIFDKLQDADALHRMLTSLGADYLLVNEARAPVAIARDAAFERRFTFVAARGTATLFDLTDRPLVRVARSERLTNSGFEAIADGVPAGWSVAGRPVIDGTGRNSQSGNVGAQCDGPENVLFQAIAVEPGLRFALNFATKEAAPGALVRLQVNWSDGAGAFIGTDIEVIQAGPQWTRRELIGTAPARAAQAVVYAACHQGGRAWLDDFSFSELAFVNTGRLSAASSPDPGVLVKLERFLPLTPSRR